MISEPVVGFPDDGDHRTRLRESYLSLLERALTHTLYDPVDSAGPDLTRTRRRVREILIRRGILFVRKSAEGRRDREEGRDWPLFAQTMVGTARLTDLRRLVERILLDQVPGDLIETGVWRGGAAIMMRGVLHAWDVADRDVWVADSFAGLPPPRAEHREDAQSWLHQEAQLVVSRQEVEENFRRYGLLDSRVHFVEGFFHETLPRLQDQRWALLRLDGDMYGSTIDALENLYPRLAVGGFVIVDDYGADGACRRAVSDYRRLHGIEEPIQHTDWTGVYWRKR